MAFWRLCSASPARFSALAAQVPDLPESANLDGFADLAVGIPGRAVGGDPGAGAVGMLYGTASGLTSAASFLFSQDTGLIDGAAEPLDHFGKALAAGDFDGDGLVDLAVSTPDEEVGDAEGAGLIHILFGGITSITSSGSQMITEDDIGGTAKLNEHFGAALASGDFNRDGYDDLAVGAPGEDFVTIESAGIVFVLKGTPNGDCPRPAFF